MSTDRLQEIKDALGQGLPPTLAQGRWLVADHADQAETIRTLTDAVIDFLNAWIGATDHAKRKKRFDDHAGQYVDV